jgi:hypothetical protein
MKYKYAFMDHPNWKIIYKNLTLRTFLIFCLATGIYSCTTTTPAYDAEAGDGWIHLDRDTIKDMGFFVGLLNNQPSANAVVYLDRLNELHPFKEIDVNLGSLKTDSMEFQLSEVSSSGRWYFTATSLTTVMPQLMNAENISDTAQVSLVCLRRYVVDPLPEKLELNYRIITADTTVTGTMMFVRSETETTEVMRWH